MFGDRLHVAVEHAQIEGSLRETLTRAGVSEDNNATGDLDIKANINLVGAGNTATVINGSQADRVIQLHSGTATITDLKITGGKTTGTSQGG